jgi:uncharacterized phage protein (TIGR02220 family)
MLGGSTTLAGHFLFSYFRNLTIKTMSKITRQKRKDNFTVVNNDILKNPNLSWAAKGMLVYLLHLPDGWQINVADLWNRSKNGRDATAAIIKELIQAGYVTRTKVKGEKNLFKGYDYTVSDEPTVNGFPVYGKSVFGDSVDGNPEASKDYQKEELNEERTKEEKKEPQPQIEKPNKQLQFVTEVVTYLNEKTKQQFKTTTKETIQFINSRVKLDSWELEDFKAVIDFKTNEWLKDDKMRQYLCPSTLFRASNAEKYLLAAKASKPKPAQQPTRPTQPVQQERPVLTQHDIEATAQNVAAVSELFKNMGVRV